MHDFGDLRKDDLIVSVAGRPSDTHFFSDDSGLRDEYLLSIDGLSVASADFIRLEPYERMRVAGALELESIRPVDHVFSTRDGPSTKPLRAFARARLGAAVPG